MAGVRIKEIAVSLPFTISPYGTVVSTEDQGKIWDDRVRTVIGTTIGERVMFPNFGTDIAKSVFSTQDGAEDEVTAAVEASFIQLLPLLTLDSTQVSFDQNSSTANVVITYRLPNDEQRQTLVGPFALTEDIQYEGRVSLRGDNPPIEESYGR